MTPEPIVDSYFVRAIFGSLYLTSSISPILIYERPEDKVLAHTLIQILAGQASRAGVPIETYRKPWVLVIGPGLDGVIGLHHRGFRSGDFRPVPKKERPLPGWVQAVCDGTLVPEEYIPKQCDKPGCEKWAQYHFGILDGLHLGSKFWGKGVGEELHACPEHAHELYKMDTHYPSSLVMKEG